MIINLPNPTKATTIATVKTPTTTKNHAFAAFDFSTKKLGLGNSSGRVVIVAYSVKYQPAHAIFLKTIFIKSSVL